jgi:hypothetical protein
MGCPFANVRSLRVKRTLCRERLMTESDPNVWSGRASQEVSLIWRFVVLHQCIQCLERVMLPAIMDISARAISLPDRPRPGHLGHQYSHALGRPILHLVSSSRRPRREAVGLPHRLLLNLCSSFVRAVQPFLRPGRCSSLSAARKGASRLAVALCLPITSALPGQP